MEPWIRHRNRPIVRALFARFHTGVAKPAPPPFGKTQPVSSLDSFKSRRTLKVGSKSYVYYSLAAAEKNGLKGISRLPNSLKVLLENLLRHEDGGTVTKADITAMAAWLTKKSSEREIAFRPARS